MEQIVDKRLYLRSEQVKQQAIYEICALMDFHGITYQDLKKPKTRSYLDDLTKIRTKRRHKKERQDALALGRKRRAEKYAARTKPKEDAEVQAQKEVQSQRYIKVQKKEAPPEPA